MRYIYIPVFFIYFSCVSPPEYDDGLIENIPAIVNDDDYFSLSLNGNKYNDSLSWELNLDLSDLDEILTTFIVKDLNVSPSDSSYIIASILTGDTIFKSNIQSEVIFSSIDSVKFIGEIKKVIFKAENFEGKLEYQLIKNPNL